MEHAAGVCPVQARWEHAGPCELGRDLARRRKIGAVLLHRDSALPAREEKRKKNKHVGGKKTTRLELAGLKRAGSVRDLVHLAVTWHGEGKTGAVLCHDAALPREE